MTSEQHRATRHIALEPPRERVSVQLFIFHQITTKSASEPPPSRERHAPTFLQTLQFSQFSSVQFSQSVVQIVANSNTIATYLTSEQRRATRHIALGPPRGKGFCSVVYIAANSNKICSRASPKKGTPRANIFTNPTVSQFSSVQFSCSNRSK